MAENGWIKMTWSPFVQDSEDRFVGGVHYKATMNWVATICATRSDGLRFRLNLPFLNEDLEFSPEEIMAIFYNQLQIAILKMEWFRSCTACSPNGICEEHAGLR